MFGFPPLLSAALLSFCVAFAVDSPCADQLQRCGVIVEEFERQLHDLKNSAFRNCFTNTACVHEKIAFDDCYAKSLRAIRTSLGSNLPSPANSDFLTAAEMFSPRLEQCFTSSGATVGDEIMTLMSGEGSGNETVATEGGTAAGGDVAHLASAIYGMELADRLWALPSGTLSREHQLLNAEGVCSAKESPTNGRMFGGGISRISDPSSPQPNNMNTSCTLSASELNCFALRLDQDPQYRLLMSSKDKAIRSCIQNVRLQPDGNCHFLRPSSHRCICEARDELDSRMQTAVLNCVQHSPVAQLYAALSSLSRWNSPAETDRAMPTRPDSSPTHQQSVSTAGPLLPSISFQTGEETLSVPSQSAVLTPGTSINGQCICACAQPTRTASVLASHDFVGKTTTASAATIPASDGIVSVGLTPQLYRPLPAMPWYYQPMQTALSAEAGIANGFERFFNGQPPLRKKREEDEDK
ncbi:hypothetical protein niasHS_014665 [Heterodera schachtii]|uniref:Uncharacterized protein n=1 Tax=Heterodera schachtii TaxID=97005 RepID=A0ABD2IHP2_HETSC